jgi:XRE family transcriptional regulator, regulator of sulfur utilization
MDLLGLGKRVQELRAERRLTLQDLAARSEVSPSMLSAVERGQKAATVVVLDRIAHGLGVSLAALVALPEDSRVVVRRAADQDVVDEPGGWRRVILTPVIPGVNFEWVHTTLPAGCDAGWFPAYAPGSHEFVAVQAGTLRLRLDDREIALDAGDSVYFAADVRHGYANPGPTACVYHIAVIVMRSRSGEKTTHGYTPRSAIAG